MAALPDGFVIDPPQGVSGLPDGFVLDGNSDSSSDPSLLSRAWNAEKGVLHADNLGARSIATGVPIIGGLLNRADAGVDALASYALNPLFSKDQQLQGSIGDRYQQALAVQNGMDQQFHAAHPYIDTAGNIAGGLAAGGGAGKLGLTLAGRFGTGAMTGLQGVAARAGIGAGENALLGALDSKARGGNALEGAELGAALGAGGGITSSIGKSGILGALMRGAAGVGIGAGVGAGGAALNGGDALSGAVTGGASALGGEALGVGARGAEAAGRAFSSDAGDGLAGRLFDAKNIARQMVANSFEQEGTTPEELTAALKKAGPSATLMDVSPTALRQAMGVSDKGALGLKTIKSFVERREAGSGQRVEDLLTSALGPRMDGAGILDQFQNERRQAAGPLYEAAMETPVSDSDGLRSLMKTPAFSSALARANTLAGNEGRTLYSPTGEMGMHGPVMAPDVSKMTLRDLHYVQRAMQDNIGDIKAGAGFRDNEASRSVSGVRKQLLAAMDEMSPEYQQARAIYAGNSAVQDAYNQGMSAFDSSTGADHLTPEAMERKLSEYDNASEQQAYLLGARQRVSNIMGGARNNRQRAYTLLGVGNENPNFDNQRKIAALLSYVKPTATQDEATQGILNEMRSRLGYAAPDRPAITADDVHDPATALLNDRGESIHPDSEEGQRIIQQRIQQAEAERDAEPPAPGLAFTAPDKERGARAVADLLAGLETERNFGVTRSETVGQSATARRIEAAKLVAPTEGKISGGPLANLTKIGTSVANALISPAIRMRGNAVNSEIANILISRDANAALRPEQAERNNVAQAIMDQMRGPAEGARISPEDEAEARRLAQRAYIPTNRDIIARALLTAALTQGNQNQQGSR